MMHKPTNHLITSQLMRCGIILRRLFTPIIDESNLSRAGSQFAIFLSNYSRKASKSDTLFESLLRMDVKSYIKELVAVEEYSFSLEELRRNTDKSGASLKLELARLIEKKEILNLRKEFYLIITPRYSAFGKLPIQLYAEKLFKFLNRNYYLGLYSAARIHGAGHQQVQREYVMIEQPALGNIKKSNLDIRFLTTSSWPATNVIKERSDAGEYNISSPILTAVDLIHHQSKLGGLNRMLAILEELLEEVKEEDCLNLLTWYSHRSSLQRLGFLMEELRIDDSIFQMLFNHLSKRPYFPVLLSPNSKQRPGAVGNRWKVDVNIKLDSNI